MKRSSLAHFPCSVARTLDIVGEWWTPMILRTICYGAVRFEAIQAELGIARNILTDRLNTLLANGILEQNQYSGHPPRYEYQLTRRGNELMTVLLALMEWGDRWLPEGHDGEYVVAVHKECGGRVHAELRCEQCGRVPSIEVRFRPGPGGHVT